MHCAGHVDEDELEREDGENPTINAGAGIEVRIGEHAFDIPCVNFYDQILNTNEVEFEGAEGAKEPVELQFWLRKA